MKIGLIDVDGHNFPNLALMRISSYHKATIVEGKLNSWDDYEGDQLQVKIDGVTYLVHSSNVVLRH